MDVIKIFGLGLMLCINAGLNAQHLSSRSNEVEIKSIVNPLPDSGPLPRITWLNPRTDVASSAAHQIDLHFTVEINAPITSITLYGFDQKNGELWGGRKIAVQPGQLFYDIRLAINLPDGNNQLNLEVITAQGFKVSDKRNLLIGSGALDNVMSVDRRDYALLFCTDKYDHWNDLVNPVDDAQALARELREKYGFIVEVIENPELEDIWTKLREYSERKFLPQDQLFVFFAGHGHYDDTFGEGYVVAKNSLLNDPSRNSFLSHNRLRAVIDNIPCNHILLTMDVCFGGTLDPVIARNRGTLDLQVSTSEFLARKWSHKTRKYLTSGGKEYVSDGIPGKHSPFAATLIESLNGLGGSDGLLTLTELQVVMEKMKQLPRFGSFGSDERQSDFVFVATKK